MIAGGSDTFWICSRFRRSAAW